MGQMQTLSLSSPAQNPCKREREKIEFEGLFYRREQMAGRMELPEAEIRLCLFKAARESHAKSRQLFNADA